MVNQVTVLSEAYKPGDLEEAKVGEIGQLFLPVGPYRIPIRSAPAGAIVLISGPILGHVQKTSTITELGETGAARLARSRASDGNAEDVAARLADLHSRIQPPEDNFYKAVNGAVPQVSAVTDSGKGRDGMTESSDEAFVEVTLRSLTSFRPLLFPSTAVYRLALEPLEPAELPRILLALRALAKVYPAAEIRAEESGEHVVSGSGELYLDCLLHDVREVMAKGAEVRVSDPFARLRESVGGLSTVQCIATSANGRCRFGLVASPLGDEVCGVNHLESFVVARLIRRWFVL